MKIQETPGRANRRRKGLIETSVNLGRRYRFRGEKWRCPGCLRVWDLDLLDEEPPPEEQEKNCYYCGEHDRPVIQPGDVVKVGQRVGVVTDFHDFPVFKPGERHPQAGSGMDNPRCGTAVFVAVPEHAGSHRLALSADASEDISVLRLMLGLVGYDRADLCMALWGASSYAIELLRKIPDGTLLKKS